MGNVFLNPVFVLTVSNPSKLQRGLETQKSGLESRDLKLETRDLIPWTSNLFGFLYLGRSGM